MMNENILGSFDYPSILQQPSLVQLGGVDYDQFYGVQHKDF